MGPQKLGYEQCEIAPKNLKNVGITFTGKIQYGFAKTCSGSSYPKSAHLGSTNQNRSSTKVQNRIEPLQISLVINFVNPGQICQKYQLCKYYSILNDSRVHDTD